MAKPIKQKGTKVGMEKEVEMPEMKTNKRVVFWQKKKGFCVGLNVLQQKKRNYRTKR